MQSQVAGRKRPAPGTSPMVQPTTTNPVNMFPNDNYISTLSDDQFLALGSEPAGNTQTNNAMEQGFDGSFNYGNDAFSQQPGQLVRRNQNQQVTTANAGYNQVDQDVWQNYGPVSGGIWQGDNGELAEKAAAAKREALSKRPPKQIPPFIQKLSSFLDNNTNEALIRWSPSGDSFIVVDEEQFANKLIPELFKHNNYASFVRQLNMYGFHKKVGLTDNSMRASERKAKTPSEYENPYFKRGRPDLLWLIAKPRATGGKKKKSGQQDESEEEEYQDEQQQDLDPGNKKNKDLITLPKSQLVSFQSEIQQLKHQQQQINGMIRRFQHENTQYIRQASAQHERHENSINAILQFLATFYTRNADGAGNIPNMFGGGNLGNNQPSGNVQEVNDYEDDQEQSTSGPRRQAKRPLALLPAPSSEEERLETPEAGGARPISASTDQPRRSSASDPSKLSGSTSNSGLRNSATPRSPVPQSTPEVGTPTQVMANSNSAPANQTTQSQSQQPPLPQQQQQQQQAATQDQAGVQRTNSEIMQLINKSNAESPNNMNLDFSSALKDYENASPGGPLTQEQRNNVLNMMASNSGATTPMTQALQAASNPMAGKSYIDQFNSNQEQLEALTKLQQEQDDRVRNLHSRLTPFSPRGGVPGFQAIHGGNNDMPNFALDNGFSLDHNNISDPNFDDFLNYDGTVNGGAGSMDLAGAGNTDFHFNDAADNYFGNVNFDGTNMPTVSGTETDASQPQDSTDLFNTTAGNDMFNTSGLDGTGDDATNMAQNFDSLRPETAEGDDDGEGGKVIGSVGTSSAGRSPAIEDEDDMEAGGRRKKQRTG